MANGNQGSFLQTFKQELGGREEEEIFLGRQSREERHPRCNWGKRWEDGAQTCVWFSDENDTTNITTRPRVLRCTGSLAHRQQGTSFTAKPKRFPAARSASCSQWKHVQHYLLTNDKPKQPNGPMQQAGRRRKQRRQHRLMHIWYKVRLNTEQNMSHFKNKVVGATSQEIAAKHSDTFVLLPCTNGFLECLKWESVRSGFHMFSWIFLDSQIRREEHLLSLHLSSVACTNTSLSRNATP